MIVRATCPTCGDVALAPQDVSMTLYGPAVVVERSWYTFTCPKCSTRVVKRADDAVRRLLVSAPGLSVRRIVLPPEALEEHDGPVITWDEVLDFETAMRTRRVADMIAEAMEGST